MMKIMKVIKQYGKLLNNIEIYLDCLDEEKAQGDEDMVFAYSKLIGANLEMCEMLHNTVVKIIDKYKAKTGEPPEYMVKLWTIFHTEFMDDFAKLKYRYEMSKK